MRSPVTHGGKILGRSPRMMLLRNLRPHRRDRMSGDDDVRTRLHATPLSLAVIRDPCAECGMVE